MKRQRDSRQASLPLMPNFRLANLRLHDEGKKSENSIQGVEQWGILFMWTLEGRQKAIDDCQRAISCLYMVVRHLSTVLAVLPL